MTLKGVATVLRVLQEKLSVMPEGAASALKQIHSQVCVHGAREQLWRTSCEKTARQTIEAVSHVPSGHSLEIASASMTIAAVTSAAQQ